MGKQSTRENKTIYQLCREEKELTREKASELMAGVSSSRIEKIEYETQEPTPYDVVQMADCYKRPDLCNYYCSHKCAIGQRLRSGSGSRRTLQYYLGDNCLSQ